VVIDFGLAAVADEVGALTRTGDQLGTPLYMAPEQVEGRPADARTDVYALGVILYELLTLEQPFRAETREATYRRILEQRVPTPRSLRPNLSRDLEAVCLKAMERAADDRYAGMAAFAEDLQRVRELRAPQARHRGSIERAARHAMRRPLRPLLAVAVIALAAAVAWSLSEQAALRRQSEVQEEAGRVIGDLHLRRELPPPRLDFLERYYPAVAEKYRVGDIEAAIQRLCNGLDEWHGEPRGLESGVEWIAVGPRDDLPDGLPVWSLRPAVLLRWPQTFTSGPQTLGVTFEPDAGDEEPRVAEVAVATDGRLQVLGYPESLRALTPGRWRVSVAGAEPGSVLRSVRSGRFLVADPDRVRDPVVRALRQFAEQGPRAGLEALRALHEQGIPQAAGHALARAAAIPDFVTPEVFDSW
jgi:hypothetical protein